MNWLISAVFLLLFAVSASAAPDLYTDFMNPPAAARPMVRWWWFGPKTQDAEIVREIRAMKAAGFGGFELQTVYPLALNGNVRFLSPENLHDIHLAGVTARAEGMRMDLTLGSGWPFGGPHIPVAQASHELVLRKMPGQSGRVVPPDLPPGAQVVAAFAGRTAASAHPLHLSGSSAIVPAADQRMELYFVISEPTGQQVKRAAFGAAGPVLDHMSRTAVNRHLDAVGEKLLSAFGPHPPYAVFSDSLEAFGSDWTDSLLTEFLRRRGYDLQPHLMALFSPGPGHAAIRYDWAETLSELTEENFLRPVTEWAHAHHTRFRAQVYGTPPVRLSSNALVDLADGEESHWRDFSDARWASSVNHLLGRPVTAAESWTWLHHGAFQAVPLDFKAEADRLMLEGINQFIAHGWPYSPPDVAEPGWAFYAAAAFSDHNPWWAVVPDLNIYLQRMSFLLRQGTAVTDVAIYLPEENAMAALHPCTPHTEYCHVSVSERAGALLPRGLQRKILDAGYSFDYVDAGLLTGHKLSYRVLILPGVRRMSADMLRRLTDFVRNGGTVLAVGHEPDKTPGFLHRQKKNAIVRKLSRRLFALKNARQIKLSDLAAALRAVRPPDVVGLEPQFGFVHRKLPDGDLYFVANTANTPVSAHLIFRAASGAAQWWEARDGSVHPWSGTAVHLAPYQSRVFVFGPAANAVVAPDIAANGASRPLGCRWSIAFGHAPPRLLKNFVSWTDMPGRAHFSGKARYACDLRITQQDLDAGRTTLDFGPGMRVPPPGGNSPGFEALLTSPVREAAVIRVNGHRAGSVWAPPYRLSLRPYLHVGENHLVISVGNTAINTLAGRPPVDYLPLYAKFGKRFSPQNMTGLRPRPSGILRAPVLAAGP